MHMNIFRRISLPLHGVIELTAGLALVLLALALDLGAAGTILTFTAGAVLAGLGLGAADSVSLRAHQSLDRLMSTALGFGGILAALTGDIVAAGLLTLAGAGLLALSAATRWTRAPLRT
jgi:hypothetical protein